MHLMQWLYTGGHPNWIATIMNRWSAALYAVGIAPNYLVTLEVSGRRSHRTIRIPLVMVVVDGERYLVSMLGSEVDWVRNVVAARGDVSLIHGRREAVHLEEIPADRRAPVLKAYLRRAPGARPHLPVRKDAPISEFEQISAQFPVFRVDPDIGSGKRLVPIGDQIEKNYPVGADQLVPDSTGNVARRAQCFFCQRTTGDTGADVVAH